MPVGELDGFAQRRLERLFLAIAANPHHLHPHAASPDAASVHRATAVLQYFDRLDDRAVDIGLLAERDIAAVGKRRAARRRARGKSRGGGKGEDREAAYVLHLPVCDLAAMNAP
jgi:hypothetical protein